VLVLDSDFIDAITLPPGGFTIRVTPP